MNKKNPYIAIPQWILASLIFFVLLNSFAKTVIQFIFFDDQPLASWRFLAKVLYYFVLYSPLIFYDKFKFGWFHPLVLPLVYKLSKSFVKSPSSFFDLRSFANSAIISNQGIEHLTSYELALNDIHNNLINTFSWIVVYATFYSLKNLKAPKFKTKRSKGVVFRLIVISLIGLGFGWYVIELGGGIVQSIYSMGIGRFKQRSELGGSHWIVMSMMLTMACFVWFAYLKSAKYNPLFYFFFAISLSIAFITTGSRSGLFIQIAVILLLYLYQIRKIPLVISASLGVIGFISIGILGQLRTSSWRSTELETDVVADFSFTEAVEKTRKEILVRPSGTMMVLGEGVQKEGLLLGRTYLSIPFFWIPRAIWPEKPRGCGAYAASLLLEDGSLKDNPSGGSGQSITLTWQAEAYWNFHYPGILLVSILYGMFLRFMGKLYITNRNIPAAVILCVICLLTFSPQSDGSTLLIQRLFIFALVMWLSGLWRPFNMKVA
ncbi:MAG: O-antigen polymerase [Bacteroidota bacterium]